MSPRPTPWHCRIFAIDPARLTPLETMLLRLAALLTLVVFYLSLRDVKTYAGVDLRNRVVGARVMLAGYDPYTFNWESGLPEEWLDPVEPGKAPRLTATPPTLWLYAAVAELPFKAIRLISFGCEWAALLASVCLLAHAVPGQRSRVVFLLGAALFFVASDFWRMHLERGQIYVFHLLALSAAIHYLRRHDLNTAAGGLALAALALLRPNLLVFAPAFLLLGRWRTAGAMLGGFALGVLATLPVMHADSWPSYLRMGDVYYRSVWAPESLPDVPWPPHDHPVEGVDFGDSLTCVESSSLAVFYQKWQEKLGLPRLDLDAVSKAVMAGLGVLLLAAIWWRRRDPAAALVLLVALGLDTEFCLPHRWAYADVLLLAPLALLWPALLGREKSGLLALILVLLGLLFGGLGGQQGQYYLTLYEATVLRSWLVMGALTLLAIQVRGRDLTAAPASPV